jgi:hypothetical protein
MTNTQVPTEACVRAAQVVLDAAFRCRIADLDARMQAVENALLAGNGRKWQDIKKN